MADHFNSPNQNDTPLVPSRASTSAENEATRKANARRLENSDTTPAAQYPPTDRAEMNSFREWLGARGFDQATDENQTNYYEYLRESGSADSTFLSVGSLTVDERAELESLRAKASIPTKAEQDRIDADTPPPSRHPYDLLTSGVFNAEQAAVLAQVLGIAPPAVQSFDEAVAPFVKTRTANKSTSDTGNFTRTERTAPKVNTAREVSANDRNR